MTNEEKQYISGLFKSENYKELYKTHSSVINQMLMIDNEDDFEFFIEEEGSLDEEVFRLHYSALHGDSLLIGGYEGDVTEKVSEFLKQRLPESLFKNIKEDIKEINADIDDNDNLEERIGTLNERLESQKYSIQIYFDDLYCAGEFFLTIDEEQ